MRQSQLFLLGLALFLVLVPITAAQSAEPIPVCDGGIRQASDAFQPGGIILTTFDRDALWVYNIDTRARYPLPETVPCTRNCHTSPDALWITRISPEQGYATQQMRFDGTQRTTLAPGAADINWWTSDTLLVWTPDHRAYLQPIGGDPLAFPDVTSAIAVQPGGYHALTLRQGTDGTFERALEDLELRGLVGVSGPAPVPLGADMPYYNAAAWSPTGEWLVYAQPTDLDPDVSAPGTELFGIRPGDTAPTQLTDLFAAYGATRINGHTLGDLSWSPDGSRVAFWVIELVGPNPLANTGNAVIHTLNINTRELRVYCGFATSEHTPNPPRLVWSPDATHIAFGGNVPDDDKGYLLLALNIADGTLTELSDGIFPALGAADVVGWGRLP